MENDLFERILRFGVIQGSENLKPSAAVTIQTKKFNLLKGPSSHLIGFIQSLKSHTISSNRVSGTLKSSFELCDFLLNSQHVLIKVSDQIQDQKNILIFASPLAMRYEKTLYDLLLILNECFYTERPCFQKGEYLLLFSQNDINLKDWKGSMHIVNTAPSFLEDIKESLLVIFPSNEIFHLDLSMLFQEAHHIEENELMCHELQTCISSLKDKLFKLHLMFMEFPIQLKSILENNPTNERTMQSQFVFCSAFAISVRK